MPGELRFDPEHLAVLIAAYGQVPVPTAPSKDLFELRYAFEQFMRTVLRQEATPEHVKRIAIPVKSHDGATIQLHQFQVSDAAATGELSPAVLYVHGGGMISCDVEIYAPQISRYVARTGIPFFAVDYRLAPEQTGDCLVKDAYAALEHISVHATDLGVDPTRIAIMGDSAGGGIAAGTALLARDRGLNPPLAKQMLIYPMLDDESAKYPPDSPKNKFLFVWSAAHSEISWNALLGKDKDGKEDAGVSTYAVPGRATDLSDLPDTYIEVGGLDLFADEVLAYVTKLAKANVQTEFHMWPGLVHGFDSAPISSSKTANEMRDNFLKTL